MNLNNFTQKAQEAALQAQNLAEELNHSQIEAVHLLAALLAQDDGVVPQIINRIGTSRQLLERSIEGHLNSMPRAMGATAQVGVSKELLNVVRAAEREASKMKDDFVSTEHLFLALIDAAANVRSLSRLAEAGIGREDVLQALTGIRGGQR